jgi:serine/threonine protein kinase
VVQPHFNFVHERRLYLVSELCADGDLHDLVATRLNAASFLEENEVLSLMHQVLQGVHYLHSALGVAHRDLSLENVLLSRGVCKITDFGLSTDSRVVCKGGRVGKEFYMAPEIVAGKRYDPALADVWSLGIMWFIMLTGSPLLPLASRAMKGFDALERHGEDAADRPPTTCFTGPSAGPSDLCIQDCCRVVDVDVLRSKLTINVQARMNCRQTGSR